MKNNAGCVPLRNVTIERWRMKHRAHIHHIGYIPLWDISYKRRPLEQLSHIGNVRNINVVQITSRSIRLNLFIDESFQLMFGCHNHWFWLHPQQLFGELFQRGSGYQIQWNRFNGWAIHHGWKLRMHHMLSIACALDAAYIFWYNIQQKDTPCSSPFQVQLPLRIANNYSLKETCEALGLASRKFKQGSAWFRIFKDELAAQYAVVVEGQRYSTLTAVVDSLDMAKTACGLPTYYRLSPGADDFGEENG